MLTIYHNPSCKKSRAGLAFLDQANASYQVVEYLKTGITEEQLQILLVKMNKKPAEILRKQEEFYKLHLKGRNFSDHELVRMMAENPKLIARPIVEGKLKAVVGDPAEEINSLL